jgi:hypothetical protein
MPMPIEPGNDDADDSPQYRLHRAENLDVPEIPSRSATGDARQILLETDASSGTAMLFIQTHY